MISYCVNIDELSEELKMQFQNLQTDRQIKVVSFDKGTHEISFNSVEFAWSGNKPITVVLNGTPHTFLRTQGKYKGNPTKLILVVPTTFCFYLED